MSARPIDPRALPPSIADDRGRAILGLFAEMSGRFEWRRDLALTWSDVPAVMLPYVVRSLSLHDFVQPDMSETVVRRMIGHAWPLHALKGKVAGVRLGLSLLGMQVDWVQWFAATPTGAPGTYVATIRVDEAVFEDEGHTITARMQKAAFRMVDATKRWSQDGSLRFAAEETVPVFVGAVVRQVIRIRPSVEPVTSLVAAPPVFVGAAVYSRVRVRPSS